MTTQNLPTPVSAFCWGDRLRPCQKCGADVWKSQGYRDCGDWRADKWNLVAKTVNEARTDAKSCMNDLRGALRAFPSPAPVRSAVDMLELYQRILFNTMDAHEQTLASKEAEIQEAALKYVSLFGELQGALEEMSRLKTAIVELLDDMDNNEGLAGADVYDRARALTTTPQPTE